MAEGEARVFRRSTACFMINAFLLALFFFMFLLGIGLEYMAAVVVAFAAALWQIIFTVWILMYPYARLEEDRMTFYARYQQRRAVRLEEITGLARHANDIDITLGDGDVVSLSLFWMNPADREPLIQALRPAPEEPEASAVEAGGNV